MLAALFIAFLASAHLVPTVPVGGVGHWFTAQDTIRFGVSPFDSRQELLASAPTKVNDSLGLKLSAAAAAVMDVGSGAVLFAKEPTTERPIASITKLMSAIVFLDQETDLSAPVAIEPDDEVGGAEIELDRGEALTATDMLIVSLAASANNATEAIARASGLSRDRFIAVMNERAVTLGMTHTAFSDPTGLTSANRSTVADLLQLARYALGNDLIRRATSEPTYVLLTNRGRALLVENTDQLLGSLPVVAGKTGWHDAAGHCVVVQIGDGNGHDIIVAVLGAPSDEARFAEARALAAWTFDNFQWE